MTSSPYNGFTAAERTRLGAVVGRKIRSGEWPEPRHCEVCGATGGRLHAHLEDYDDPASYVGLCWPCHLALHTRFGRPQTWLRRLERIDADGTWTVPAWARELRLERIDLRTLK